MVNDQEFHWGEKDVLAIPSWATYRHVNTSRSDNAVLFSYSSEPVVKALGLYRDELARADTDSAASVSRGVRTTE